MSGNLQPMSAQILLPGHQARAASLVAAQIALVYKLEPEIADEITKTVVQAVTGLEMEIVDSPTRQQLLAPLRRPPAATA